MSFVRKMRKLKSLVIGKVKDRVSLTKAKVVHSFRSSNSLKYVHLALLKSTTHTSNKPPNDGYVSDIVSYSNSRYGPAAFAAALWRLRVTKNAFVANKTLIVLHKLMKSSRYKFEGFNHGRNDLKFDDFCDQSSHITLELSQWVKWYGQYLDRLSCISLVLGSFPILPECSKEKSKEKICVSSYQTGYIFRQTDCLVSLFVHICTRPEIPRLYQNKIVDETRELVMEDYFAVMRLITIRIELLHERFVKPGIEPDVRNSGLYDLNTVTFDNLDQFGEKNRFILGLETNYGCIIAITFNSVIWFVFNSLICYFIILNATVNILFFLFLVKEKTVNELLNKIRIYIFKGYFKIHIRTYSMVNLKI